MTLRLFCAKTLTMRVLGIETSCDETAAAVVDPATRTVLGNAVYSQYEEHADYGGVVPEIAARAHQERLPELVQKALDDANVTLADIDLFSATVGPGLLGGLLMGSTYARALALGAQKPFLGVNHLEGHALSPQLAEPLDFPYLLLLVSGGHCQFIHVKELGVYEELGTTLDDAIGECFDKTAKLLGLPHPGGPAVEQQAKNGKADAYTLPFPLNDGSLNFSFSGMKTAVRTLAQQEAPLNTAKVANICASFQAQCAHILVKKVEKALEVSGAQRFVIAGGVAANTIIRTALNDLCTQKNITFLAPPLAFCTDNAAMVAYAAGLRALAGEGKTGHTSTAVRPRWPLNTLAAPVKIG
jgi:N6-L-threonylcarbamoyladenine synthase